MNVLDHYPLCRLLQDRDRVRKNFIKLNEEFMELQTKNDLQKD